MKFKYILSVVLFALFLGYEAKAYENYVIIGINDGQTISLQAGETASINITLRTNYLDSYQYYAHMDCHLALNGSIGIHAEIDPTTPCYVINYPGAVSSFRINVTAIENLDALKLLQVSVGRSNCETGRATGNIEVASSPYSALDQTMPQGLSINSAYVLSWLPVIGATSYNVYCSTSFSTLVYYALNSTTNSLAIGSQYFGRDCVATAVTAAGESYISQSLNIPAIPVPDTTTTTTGGGKGKGRRK